MKKSDKYILLEFESSGQSLVLGILRYVESKFQNLSRLNKNKKVVNSNVLLM